MNMQTPTPTISLPQNITSGQLIAQFLKLRNRIKEKEDEQKKALAPAKEMLALMNAKLLDMLNQAAVDSIAAPDGTAYKTERSTASISEGQEFRDYVVANELFDLLDWKANATAVKDHINEFGAPPPGVKLTTVLTVNVRTASGK